MTESPAPLADFSDLCVARHLWSTGAMGQAIAAFEAARQAHPASIRARIEFARALAQVYEITPAEQLLDEAWALAGSDNGLQAAVAPVYAEIYRPERAVPLLEELVQPEPPSPLHVELVKHYEKLGRIDEAAELLDDLIAKLPDVSHLIVARARLARRRGDHARAAGLLDAVCTGTEAPPNLQAEAFTELCQLRDAEGDHQAAVKAVEQAKRLASNTPGVDDLRERSAALDKTFRKLYGDLDESTVNRWLDADLPPARDAAGFAQLIGFPRSGTTLLEQALRAHPRVFVSSERALFSGYVFPAAYRDSGRLSVEALDAIPFQQLLQSRERYVACSAAIEGEPIAGRRHLDKNPNHTSLAAGLLRLFPESRFLFAVRDPRDVIVSIYLRSFPLTEFSVNFLRLEDLVALYDAEMSNWMKFRELIPGQWTEVRYEEVVADFRTTMARVLDFLGLGWSDEVLGYRGKLEGRRVNSPSHDTVRQPIYSSATGRWRNYEELLAPVMSVLAPWLKRFRYD